MDDFDALDASTLLLRETLGRVQADAWELPSACEGWTVRDVANHVIGGADRYRLYFEPEPAELLAASRTHDYVGQNPVETFDALTAQLREVLMSPGALDRVVPHRAGSIPGQQLLEMRVMEQAVHAWDIAFGWGEDLAIGEDLCAYLLTTTSNVEWLRSKGLSLYRDAVPTSSGRSQERLLRLSGRR
ncbi:MAG: TIGR03086 family metal-binding protein [Marmoricola sp.]